MAALVAVIACSPFSSDDAPAPDNDAGTTGPDAGRDADGDGALDGGAPACAALAPVVIGDGGEARCGDGGTEIVLASSTPVGGFRC